MQPLHEREIVSQAAEICHGCVGMGIDEAWQDKAMLSGKQLGFWIFCDKFRSIACFNDGVLPNGNSAIRQNCSVLGLRIEISSGDQKIGIIPRLAHMLI